MRLWNWSSKIQTITSLMQKASWIFQACEWNPWSWPHRAVQDMLRMANPHHWTLEERMGGTGGAILPVLAGVSSQENHCVIAWVRRHQWLWAMIAKSSTITSAKRMPLGSAGVNSVLFQVGESIPPNAKGLQLASHKPKERHREQPHGSAGRDGAKGDCAELIWQFGAA